MLQVRKSHFCETSVIFLHCCCFMSEKQVLMTVFNCLGFFMKQWPSGQGTLFPIQGSFVQNHWVALRLTQSFILQRLIKWVPGISGNLVVKSKLLLEVTLTLRQLNPIHKKGP